MKKKVLKFTVELTQNQSEGIIQYLGKRQKEMYLSEIEIHNIKNGLWELIISREIITKNDKKYFNRDIADIFWYAGRNNYASLL
jgi:uncharacterized protein YqgQ